MLFIYSLGSRIGFCKFLILLATIVNSILIGVSFDQSSADNRRRHNKLEKHYESQSMIHILYVAIGVFNDGGSIIYF